MAFQFHDVVGAIGVVLIVWIYFLLQVGKVHTDSLAFSAINAVGAVLILFSLCFEFNRSAFLIELFWLLISAIGMVRHFVRRSSTSP